MDATLYWLVETMDADYWGPRIMRMVEKRLEKAERRESMGQLRGICLFEVAHVCMTSAKFVTEYLTNSVVKFMFSLI